MKKILVMGLPGSGKTTLASELVTLLNAKWLNADKIRQELNDWDFSEEARLRQAKRMSDYADKYNKCANHNTYAFYNIHPMLLFGFRRLTWRRGQRTFRCRNCWQSLVALFRRFYPI